MCTLTAAYLTDISSKSTCMTLLFTANYHLRKVIRLTISWRTLLSQVTASMSLLHTRYALLFTVVLSYKEFYMVLWGHCLLKVRMRPGCAIPLHISHLAILVLGLKNDIDTHESLHGISFMEYNGFAGKLKLLTQIGLVKYFSKMCTPNPSCM